MEGIGIPIRHTNPYTLSFADNQMVMSRTRKVSVLCLRRLQEEYRKNGLERNFNKNEYLATTGEDVQLSLIHI